MPFEVDGSELEAAFEDMSKDAAMDFADDWFSRSQEILYEGGDRMGYEVYSVAQSGIPPDWDESRGGFVFGYTHEAANIFEFGAKQHEIPPGEKGFLAWKNDDGEWVYTTEPVQHPGVIAIRYVQKAKQRAEKSVDE